MLFKDAGSDTDTMQLYPSPLELALDEVSAANATQWIFPSTAKKQIEAFGY